MENYDKFEPTGIDEAECKVEFRFEKSDLPQLAEALRIPQASTKNCLQWDGRVVYAFKNGLPLQIQRSNFTIW